MAYDVDAAFVAIEYRVVSETFSDMVVYTNRQSAEIMRVKTEERTKCVCWLETRRVITEKWSKVNGE